MDGAAHYFMVVVLAPAQLAVAQRGRASHHIDERGLLMLSMWYRIPIVRLRLGSRINWIGLLQEGVIATIHAIHHKVVEVEVGSTSVHREEHRIGVCGSASSCVFVMTGVLTWVNSSISASNVNVIVNCAAWIAVQRNGIAIAVAVNHVRSHLDGSDYQYVVARGPAMVEYALDAL